MFTNYLLITFCVLSLLCSIMVIASKNPIHSILYLILVFCNVTFVLIILGVEFIAIIFLIVYVGAIAVLFLFVVMMLNIKIIELDEVFWKYIPVGLVISSCFLFQLFYFVLGFDILQVLSLFFCGEFFSITSAESILLFPHFKSSSLINGFFLPQPISLAFNVSGLYLEQTFYFKPLSEYFYLNGLSFSYELTNTEVLGWMVYTYTFFIFLIISLILLISMVGSIILVLNQNINIKRQVIFRQTLRNLHSSVSLKY
jgi:NADH-ubiquinone oxidoreductase chain 6